MNNNVIKDSARKTMGTVYRKPVLAGVSKLYPAKKIILSRDFCKNGGRFFPPLGGMRLW